MTRAPPGVGANSLTSAGLLSIGTVSGRDRICPAPVGSHVSTSSDTPIITGNPGEGSTGIAADLLTSGKDKRL